MLNIRKNLFETNSSSVHALVIPRDQVLRIPMTVNLTYGEYGWEFDTYADTINYMYTACKDLGNDYVDKLINYLKHKGVQTVNDLGNPYHKYGIDHSDEVPVDELFANEDLLDRFLFGVESYIETGNDNEDDCPEDYNYMDGNDVLMKYN